MRPRANTISHIDGTRLNLLTDTNPVAGRLAGFSGGMSHHMSLNGLPGFDFRAMSGSIGHHGNPHALPRLDTHLNIELGGGLRTAPIPGLGDTFDFDKIFATGSTINPAQLHFSDALGTPTSPFPAFPPFLAGSGTEDEDGFDWTGGLDNPMLFHGSNDQAADESSPSAVSTASQSGFSEVMLDGSNNPARTSGGMWPTPSMAPSMMDAAPYNLDAMASAFPDIISPPNTISPRELQDLNTPDAFLFSTPPPLSALSPKLAIPGMPNQYFHPPMAFSSDNTSISSASINGSGRQSSVTSVSTDSINDATRHALIISLSQPSGFGHSHRKFSQSSASSPLSPGFGTRPTAPVASLPSTADLRRYVSAYIHYFHPHLPFLHIPTLSFDSPIFTSNMRLYPSFGQDNIVGGGGCLILAMAAIGALYEFEHGPAKELFEAAKKMISIFLEERRKAGVMAASNASNTPGGSPNQKTPLWLVQAMLLNLIFGHNCGDKVAAEIATTHCAALVSLAKAAELEKPDPDATLDDGRPHGARNNSIGSDIEMGEDGLPLDGWGKSTPQAGMDEHAEWYRWKSQEERKRTLFAIFVLSSLLVTAYNQAPRILNSELRLDLPCEEDLWAAESAQAWSVMGGAAGAEAKATSFAEALSFLLTASQRSPQEHRVLSSYHPAFGSSVPLDELPESDLKPSTFGCYVLINALHVYIWETRQRHNGRQWKTQETEQMHAQIEPALKAWQAAWRSNPHHSLERPNPFGPLPADSIPLLDLAYVRLFVNLGQSKLAFWERNFDKMAEELARGVEIIQHASRDNSSEPTDSTTSTTNSSISPGATTSPSDSSATAELRSEGFKSVLPSIEPGQSSKRERHLRKAAFYAADSLSMSDKLGVTFAEFTSRELPIQSALCTFDCTQVLAEWVATVQERVGRFLGIIGRDEIDFSQVPAIMLLEDEDCKLLEKIADILNHADMKMAFDASGTGSSAAMSALGGLSGAHCGYGSKLLLVTAYMLEKSAVWPGKCSGHQPL